MIFVNRSEAGRSLAWRLQKYAKHEDLAVLGIPRGGVPVAFEVAEALEAPLDVFLLRKLGVPGHRELAFGAIAAGGVVVLDEGMVRALSISDLEIEIAIDREKSELRRMDATYRHDRPDISLAGRIVILVDDGVATGASLKAGIRALRKLGPSRIVVAAPVASPSAYRILANEADELICTATPQPFHAVGEFYDDFSQVEDQEVVDQLAINQMSLAWSVT